MDQHITRVALGKAHCIALNTKGHVFSFGLNNKGQCGRPVGKEVIAALESEDEKLPPTKYDIICDFEDHIVVQGKCRVCVLCRECTGYSVSCVSTQNVVIEDRIPGA